jgi:hypothetical protein
MLGLRRFGRRLFPRLFPHLATAARSPAKPDDDYAPGRGFASPVRHQLLDMLAS